MTILLIVLSVAGFLLCFIKSKNIYFDKFMIFIMWILFAFSFETADYPIYIRRYYTNEIESTEPLFNLIIKIFNIFCIDFKIFIIVVATVYFFALSKFISKEPNMRKSAGFALCLYFIYPLCMDITQIRSTMAFIPILFGFHYLNKDNLKNDLKFIFCVFLSMLIHFSGAFFIILLIAKKLTIKQSIGVSAICMIFISSLNNMQDLFLVIADKFGMYNKVWTVLNNDIMHNEGTISGTKKMMVVTFLIIIVFSLFLLKNLKNRNLNFLKNKDKDYVKYLIKINCLVMVTLPIVNYATDIFRIQRSLLIFAYIGVCLYINNKKDYLEHYDFRLIIYKICSLIIPLTGFYINIIRSEIFDTTIIPVFGNNWLFN